MLRTAIFSAARTARNAAAAIPSARSLSSAATPNFDLFNPTDEHKALREMLRTFTTNEIEPQANDFNRAEKFNRPLFNKLGEIGVLGLTVDPAYGGSGMDATAATIVHEEMSSSDPAFCLSYLAHSMLFTHNLFINGNEDQKQRFLPGACTGQLIGGMGMSEPWAGTDVLGMKTTAVAKGDSYVINGAKMWITNGAVADDELGDVFLVYAKTGEQNGRPQVSLFLVEKGMEGFSLGTRIKDKCGMRASMTAELAFQDVVVPKENLVGDQGGAMLCMMRNLEIERVVLAAMSLGIARRCIEVMNKYGQERKSFGKPLNTFGQIQRHIAESYAEFMAGRTYTYNVANQLDLFSQGNRIDSDGVKLYSTVMATTVANRAVQVLGGNGYIGEYAVERLWRDAKLLEIGGGTLEAHQKNMTRDLTAVEHL